MVQLVGGGRGGGGLLVVLLRVWLRALHLLVLQLLVLHVWLHA